MTHTREPLLVLLARLSMCATAYAQTLDAITGDAVWT
jgi:hypothetical protein